MFLLSLFSFKLSRSFCNIQNVKQSLLNVASDQKQPKARLHLLKVLNLIFWKVSEGSSSLATQPVLQIASNQCEDDSPSDQSAAVEGGARGYSQSTRGQTLDSALAWLVVFSCARHPHARGTKRTKRQKPHGAHAWSHCKHVVQKSK